MYDYLDNAATTRTREPVAKVVQEMLLSDYGNPSSLHDLGLQAKRRISAARSQMAALLGCAPDSVVFTGSGTEANNLALQGAAAAQLRLGRHILISAVEHACVRQCAAYLGNNGWDVEELVPDAQRQITPQAVAGRVRADTALVSIMHVNNETGDIYPVTDIARAVKGKNPRTLVHCDGVQAFGKIPLDLQWQDIDLYGVSGHKIGAPKGVGALYIKKGVRLLPLIHGGGQEKGLRSGTEPAAFIAAFGAAAELAGNELAENRLRAETLRERLLRQAAEMEGVKVNSLPSGSPYIINLSLVGYPSEVVLHFLEKRGVYVSSGSACGRGKKSETLIAMGLGETLVRSALRVSFCWESSEKAVDAFCSGLAAARRELCR